MQKPRNGGPFRGSALVACAQPRTTLPALRQEVHTFMRLRCERPSLACTVWMFGFHRRLVFRWECETELPKPGPLLQTSQTAATSDTPYFAFDVLPRPRRGSLSSDAAMNPRERCPLGDPDRWAGLDHVPLGLLLARGDLLPAGSRCGPACLTGALGHRHPGPDKPTPRPDRARRPLTCGVGGAFRGDAAEVSLPDPLRGSSRKHPLRFRCGGKSGGAAGVRRGSRAPVGA